MARAAKVKTATTSSPQKAHVASGKPQATGKVQASKAKSAQAPKAVPVKSESQAAPAKAEPIAAVPALVVAETSAKRATAKAKQPEPAATGKSGKASAEKASSAKIAPAKVEPPKVESTERAAPATPAAKSKPARAAKPKSAPAAPAAKSEPIPPPVAVAASRQGDAARPVPAKADTVATPGSEPDPAPEPKPVVATEAPAAAAAPKPKPKEEPTGTDDMSVMSYLIRDPEAFARNIARIMEGAGKAAAAYMRPRESGVYRSDKGEELTAVFKTLANVGEYWMADPARAFDAQARLWTGYMDIWNRTLQRLGGEAVEPAIKPDPRDKRFQDPEWSKNQFFDFIKQMYLMTTRWADQMVTDAEGLDEHTRLKAEFYIKQIADAAAPSNFVMTNPELLRETLAENGENLVRGMEMLAEDIAAGGGDLKIRQTSAGNFKIGENLATTPGKVIYQNDICQIIQYEPATAEVYKRPLLIVPPWINKFYILDLNADKSFIKWAVGQGRTVFVISWVNPDQRQAEKSFEQYMKEGILTGLDVIEKSTGERGVDTIGYCVGGTLLAVTLAWCAATGDDRIKSATFFTTQVDFTYAGELKAFVDEDQIRVLEQSMKERGYLEGKKMSSSFNMLRPNDLIWPYFINNYMKGKEPFPFDLLYWNADATRMPAANHSFYLRNCYLDNNLSRGEMKIGGIKLDLSKVKIPIYNLAAREDHIAPARSVFVGSGLFGGPVEYVMSGSGHIAGVVNPPAKGKYQFWTGGKPAGEFEDWVKSAKETPGSWWPHWAEWVAALAPEKVPAREPGGGRLNAIEDAPGSYVKMKA